MGSLLEGLEGSVESLCVLLVLSLIVLDGSRFCFLTLNEGVFLDIGVDMCVSASVFPCIILFLERCSGRMVAIFVSVEKCRTLPLSYYTQLHKTTTNILKVILIMKMKVKTFSINI